MPEKAEECEDAPGVAEFEENMAKRIEVLSEMLHIYMFQWNEIHNLDMDRLFETSEEERKKMLKNKNYEILDYLFFAECALGEVRDILNESNKLTRWNHENAIKELERKHKLKTTNLSNFTIPNCEDYGQPYQSAQRKENLCT